MIKELKAFLSHDGFMQGVVARLAQMVADASFVYTRAWDVCTGQAAAEETADLLRRHDKDVNRGERAVRRMVVEHLTINPAQDVSGCLAILIMAKDIERIGDHATNVFGLGSRVAGELPGFKLYDKIAPIGQAIGEILPQLERAVGQMDEQIARGILERYQEVKVAVKDLQEIVFTAELVGKECVASALITRYLMRLNAHIGNAASGVVFPIENIDFVSRGLKKEARA